MDQLEFERGEASEATLASLTREYWSKLKTAEGRAELQAAGFDVDLTAARVRFKFKPGQMGSPGLAETVLIGIYVTKVAAPVTKQMLLDIWKVVVLPKIKRRFGAEALGGERVKPRSEKKKKASAKKPTARRGK